MTPQDPFTIEQVYNAPIERVWEAITRKEQMKEWYFDLAAFKPEVGFEFRFYAGDEKKQWLHHCKITEVIKEKRLQYSWRYDGYPGISYVTFELTRKGTNTMLKLTHSGLETFPAETVPEFRKENFAAGWTHITGTSLRKFIDQNVPS